MAVAASALGLSSCSETWDGNPVLETHDGIETKEFLNTPVLENEYIMLSQSNREGTFKLTCSQPDYGYAAVATYKVQVCLEKDFKDAYVDEDGNEVPANYIELTQGFYNCSNINPLNHDMASAIENLNGVRTEDDVPIPYQEVFVRLRAFVAQDEAHTTYLSNVVSYKHIAADYLAVWIVGEAVDLYMRGGMNDWGAVPAWQFKTGDEENTWVLDNVTIGANVSIKVSTATWSTPNLGGDAGENDDSQMINANEKLAMTMGDNPGHMRLKEDFTGKVVLSLENGVYYITFDSNGADDAE